MLASRRRSVAWRAPPRARASLSLCREARKMNILFKVRFGAWLLFKALPYALIIGTIDWFKHTYWRKFKKILTTPTRA